MVRDVFITKAAALLFDDVTTVYMSLREDVVRHNHDLWGKYIEEIFAGFQKFQSRRHNVVERIAALAYHAEPEIARFANALIKHNQMRIEVIPTSSGRACDMDPSQPALYCLTVTNSDATLIHELFVSEKAACVFLLYHEFLVFEHDVTAFASTVLMLYEHSNFSRVGEDTQIVPDTYSVCTTRHDLSRIVFRSTCAWNALSGHVRGFLKKRFHALEEYIGYIHGNMY